MERCKTCVHFKRNSIDFGECNSPKLIHGIGMNVVDSNRRDVHEPDVYTSTGKYHSVGEDFGCVHHKQDKD